MKKPLKAFYSTDWHWTMKTPEARIDDFAASLEQEIRCFFQMGADLGCDCYMVDGDFVDSSFLTPNSIIRLGEIIREELRKTQKKLYYTLGNHDLIAYNPKSITNTAFGVFLRFFDDQMIHLSRTTPIVLEYGGFPVAVTGVDSYSLIDKHIYDASNEIAFHRSRDWIVEDNQGMPWIHMAHGFLSPKPVLDSIAHTVIDEMRHTKASVTLGGHEHGGFPITKLDHGLACNPGAMGRVFASLSEMLRVPKFAMVTIYPDGTPEINLYDCPVSAPGDMIMDRTKLDEKKAKDAFLAQVRESVDQVMGDVNIKEVNVHVIMARYKEKTKPAVYREVERRLQMQEGVRP